MNKTIIKTDKSPAAIGPYSQAVEVNGIIYTSGMIAIVPATGEIVEGGVEAQTKQVFDNLKALLTAAGSGLDQVFKTTVFIKDMNDFAAVNSIYATYFDGDYPARSCVEVARLPKDVLIEVEVMALKK